MQSIDNDGQRNLSLFSGLKRGCLMAVSLLAITCATHAQQSQEQTARSPEREPIRLDREPVQRQPVARGNDGVLRLQAVIRGDQQQPRILSIVPWDSPAHRRTSRVALTGEASDTLAPLHRHAFLQRIALHDQLKLAIPTKAEAQ